MASIGDEAASRCEIRVCDFSSMASVRGLTTALGSEGVKVDFLFLNAGVFNVPYRLTEEGFEYTYASNYLGHLADWRRSAASS